MEALAAEVRAPRVGASPAASRAGSPARSVRREPEASPLLRALSTASTCPNGNFPSGDVPQNSRNYQTFTQHAEKKAFAGTAREEVLQWRRTFVSHGHSCGVTGQEVLRGLPLFVTGQANSFFQEQLETAAAGTPRARA